MLPSLTGRLPDDGPDTVALCCAKGLSLSAVLGNFYSRPNQATSMDRGSANGEEAPARERPDLEVWHIAELGLGLNGPIQRPKPRAPCQQYALQSSKSLTEGRDARGGHKGRATIGGVHRSSADKDKKAGSKMQLT